MGRVSGLTSSIELLYSDIVVTSVELEKSVCLPSPLRVVLEAQGSLLVVEASDEGDCGVVDKERGEVDQSPEEFDPVESMWLSAGIPTALPEILYRLPQPLMLQYIF